MSAMAAFQNYLNASKMQKSFHASDQDTYCKYKRKDGTIVYEFMNHRVVFDNNGNQLANEPTGRTTIVLKEKNNELPVKKSVTVNVVGNRHWLLIKPVGYGAPDIGTGKGIPLFLEVYDNELRVVAIPNIQDTSYDEIQVISLEGAREDLLTDKLQPV